VIAHGGRYDKLVAEFLPPTTPSSHVHCHSSGVVVSLDKLLALVTSKYPVCQSCHSFFFFWFLFDMRIIIMCF
jgi:hypothetical protein